MRKSKILALLLLVCLVFINLVGCTDDSPEAFLKKIENSRSMTMELTMEMQGMTMNFTLKADGDKAYHSGFTAIPETYAEHVDEKLYIYTKSGGKWTKEETDAEVYNEFFSQLDFDDELFENFFDSDNLEYDKETKRYNFKQLFEVEEIMISSAYLTIQSNGCTMYYDIETNISGMEMNVKTTIVIKDINKTKITLPEVETESE